jgi:hypothetical protein
LYLKISIHFTFPKCLTSITQHRGRGELEPLVTHPLHVYSSTSLVSIKVEFSFLISSAELGNLLSPDAESVVVVVVVDDFRKSTSLPT